MIEENAESADWIKTGTWDLIGVETVQQLLVAIGKPDGGKRAVREFLRPPAGPMAAKLRAEVRRRVAGRPPCCALAG